MLIGVARSGVAGTPKLDKILPKNDELFGCGGGAGLGGVTGGGAAGWSITGGGACFS